MIFLLVAAAVVVGAPLAAAMLVTVASHHEDSAHTLGGRPPGLLTAAARRLLSMPSGAIGYPRHRQPPQTPDRRDLGAAPYIPRPRPATDDDPASTTLTAPRR